MEIFAKASGRPVPLIKWLKDGREIIRSNKIYKTRLNLDGEYILEVECVVAKTAGKITFVATNEAGEIKAETEISVGKSGFY